MRKEGLPSDYVYAYALSKTLTQVSSPATVGLYSSCQNRINMILRHIEVYMEQEAAEREKKFKGPSKPRSAKPSLTDLVALIWRLIFYRPVWNKESQLHDNVRFINVRFSAWHFAGSDLLWAGLVMRLCGSLQQSFGKLQLGLYRVVQHDEEDEVKKKVIDESMNEWRSKKLCCFPLWVLFVSVLLAVVAILVLLVIFGFPKKALQAGDEGGSGDGDGEVNGPGAGVLEGLAIAALGVPAAGALRFVFLMGKNLIFNQDRTIRQGMDNEKISNQLGFMNEVRKEMWLLSQFIQFMEVFERRKIRVVLEITNLDRCAPQKIVGVLDAINILLSAEDSPFISLLAVNPEILVQQVDIADGCFTKEDRGYAFLNRIVTLAFTIPPLCDASKCKVFQNITEGQSEMIEDGGDKEGKGKKIPGRDKEGKAMHREVSLASIEGAVQRKESSIPLIDRNEIKDPTDSVNKVIQSAFDTVFAGSEGNLHEYISDDTMSMRRVINSIRVTVMIMEDLKSEPMGGVQIAAWVVLANQWPCRLSWVLQCLEDLQQRAKIEGNDVDEAMTLWEIFSGSKLELHMMGDEIEHLLEQDGDPELFEKFLKNDFPFTVGVAETFKPSTVNLDHSIRKELGKIRGVSSLKDSGWRKDLAPLPIRTVIKMSPEDVCKELEKLNYLDKYADVIQSNHLSGQALIFGDSGDLKNVLQMTFGEWTTFRLHFLGIGQSPQPQNKAMEVTNQRLGYHLSRHAQLR